jgi:NAD+ synthase
LRATGNMWAFTTVPTVNNFERREEAIIMSVERTVESIIEWIRRRTGLAGVRGAVFGLSGGLDSAVVGALCKKALGEDTLGVIMPCQSLSSDMDDALMVAETFGIKTITVDLGKTLQSLLEALPPGCDKAVSNIKPRLRMTTLYFVANDLGMMVVGTSNKSERSVGYFTKYGDGGADICPLADIYKTDLYEIAGFLGVPRRIMDKPPSAGLAEGQTDEGDLGLGYRELDSILKDLQEGRPPSQDPALVARVRRLIDASEHKRAPITMFNMHQTSDTDSEL